MKLLTLNTHSLQEADHEQKLEQFVEAVLREKPDIIALQEVCQTADTELAEDALWAGQYLMPTRVPLREDNHGAQVAFRLRQAGIDCYWVWLPIKKGYGKYDEGVALLSLGRKITAARAFPISKTNEYHNWRTRAALGVRVEGSEDWFYSIHMGWWEDTEEPFRQQWELLQEDIRSQKENGTVWLMGDFNAPDSIPDQSYARICNDGWLDTHLAAEQREGTYTVAGIIDGWQDKPPDRKDGGMRLDYIFCSRKKGIFSSRILFDGEREPVVSDHFGVLIETKEE